MYNGLQIKKLFHKKKGDNETEFYVDDKVLINSNLVVGCYGAEGKVGFITEEENTQGLLKSEKGINVKIENSNGIWRVNKNALELIERKSFKKEDLKDGMVIEYRNGDRLVVQGKFIKNLNSYDCLCYYNEDLKHERADKSVRFKKLNIVKVYDDRDRCCNLKNMLENPQNLIWEVKEEPVTKDISLEEINNLLKEKYPNIEKFNFIIDN